MKTLVRIAAGFVLACVVAGAVQTLLQVRAPGDVGAMGGIVDATLTIATWVLPFGLLGVLAAEWLRIRHGMYFASAGIVAALAAALASIITTVSDLAGLAPTRSLWTVGAMGLLGGLTYWLASGVKSGWRGDAEETGFASARSTLSATLANHPRQRCWPCLLGGLALAALPFLALGALMIHRPGNDAVMTAKTEEHAKAALAEAGFPWARLRIDDHRGYIVGAAPTESARAAAFEHANKILAPTIGIAGVVASLQNDLTVPATVAASSLPAVPAAADVTRKADEERVAAEADAKRRADEARVAAVSPQPTTPTAVQPPPPLPAAAAAPPPAAVVATPAPSTRVTAVASACSADVNDRLQSQRLTFDAGSLAIGDAGTATLDRVAAAIKVCAEVKLRVSGHTDGVGDLAYNANLSAARSVAVRDALIVRGISRDRIVVKARGASAPVASNDTGPGRATNRRVDFAAVVVTLDELERINSCRTDLAGLVSSNGIVFRPGSAEITEESQTKLDGLATAAKACAAFGLLVEAHADRTGNPQLTMALSDLRANALRAALVQRGVPAAAIAAKGFGASRPIVPGTTPEAHARNRRIEISVGSDFQTPRN